MKKIILLTCVLFCCFKHSYAQRLDPLFGGKGFVTTDFKKGNLLFEVGRQILTQKDGNFIAVIEIGGRTSIARFLSNGKIDSSFANKGYSQFMSISEAKAVQQSDGKIAVAGNNYNDYTNYDFTLFRYNTDGSPDIGFGEDGKVITDFGSADYVSSVALQSNGNIVVTGYTDNRTTSAGNSNFDFAIARYTGSGLPDLSFDNDGKLTHDFYGWEDLASSAVVQADGKIIVAGTAFKPAACERCSPEDGQNESVLVRYNNNGSLDRSFDGDGKAIIDFGSGSPSLALQPDGKILVASSNGDIVLGRYNSNGSTDVGFGVGGRVTTDFGFNDYPTSVALQSDGKIVLSALAGGYTETDSNDFALVRYNNDGSPDISFDGDGKLTTDFGFNEFANAAAIQSDGKIVVAGGSYNAVTNNEDFAFSRYNSNGSLDNSFSKDGKELGYYSTGNSDLYSIAVQSDGKILVGGIGYNSANSYGFGVARYNRNGSLDAGFDKDGKLITNFEVNAYANSIALQSDGKILAGGGEKLVRYNSDGSLDNTFDKDGKLTTSFTVRNIKLQKDGKIVIAGVAESDYRFSFALARYNSDGSLDVSFGRQGQLKTTFFGEDDQAFSVALQGDGKIVVAGHAYNSSTGVDFALARYNSNGSLDVSFSGDGKLTTDFSGFNDFVNSLAIQTDGKIVVAGSSYYDDSNSQDFAVARYNSNGSLDKAFSEDGKLTTDFGYADVISSVALQSDGKIIAAGLTVDINSAEDIAIARYNKNGSLDSAFDGDGRLVTDFGYNERANAVTLYDNRIFAAGNSVSLSGRALVAVYDLTISPNKAPVVSITSPANNAVYYAPATINLSASATDADGTISNVKFYNGTTLLKTEYYYPYTYTWSSVGPGIYSITAKATDNRGLVTASSIVKVSVLANKAPTVTITSPADNAIYTTPATINISAAATDAFGSISSVKFYNGTTLLKTDSTSPYTYSWSNVPAGNYSITAKATDNRGLSASSAIVYVSVTANKAPVVSITSPANNSVYCAPATINLSASAKDADGKISNVKFYNGTTLLRTEYYYPYTYTWKDVAPGNYLLKAVAADNGGLVTASAVATISVKARHTIVSRLFSINDQTVANGSLSLRLSPNPTKDILHIYIKEMQKKKSLTLSVISSSGIVMKMIRTTGAGQSLPLDVSSLPKGVYTIKVMCGDRVMYGQFVKL